VFIFMLVMIGERMVVESQTLTYKTPTGEIKHCRICSKDFEEGDIVLDCYSDDWNKNIRLFCSNGRLPACPPSADVCGRTVNCTKTRPDEECQVPFMKDTNLTCNNSLQWQGSVNCSSVCPNITRVCGKLVNCPNNWPGEVCQVNSANLRCNDILQWHGDYKCLSVSTNPTTNPTNRIQVDQRNYIIVLGVIVVVLIIFASLYCKKWRKKRKPEDSTQAGTELTVMQPLNWTRSETES
ncbi:uncharacterized protein LOC115218424 isoform X1, partial [Argonauta hians]